MNTRAIATEYRLMQWTKLLQERAANSESIQAFCRRNGISKNTYFYWQRKLRETTCERLAEMQTEPTGITVPSFTEVRLAEPPILTESNQQPQIRVEIGDCKITADSGYPTKTLVALLREIKKPC